MRNPCRSGPCKTSNASKTTPRPLVRRRNEQDCSCLTAAGRCGQTRMAARGFRVTAQAELPCITLTGDLKLADVRPTQTAIDGHAVRSGAVVRNRGRTRLAKLLWTGSGLDGWVLLGRKPSRHAPTKSIRIQRQWAPRRVPTKFPANPTTLRRYSPNSAKTT